MTPTLYKAAVDCLVTTRLELGLVLAGARYDVREYPSGRVLVLRVSELVAETLRDGRKSYEPEIIAAFAAVGVLFDAVAFVEHEVFA